MTLPILGMHSTAPRGFLDIRPNYIIFAVDSSLIKGILSCIKKGLNCWFYYISFPLDGKPWWFEKQLFKKRTISIHV